MADNAAEAFCPLCDRKFTSRTKVLAWLKVKKHARNAHPEYTNDIED